MALEDQEVHPWDVETFPWVDLVAYPLDPFLLVEKGLVDASHVAHLNGSFLCHAEPSAYRACERELPDLKKYSSCSRGHEILC